MRGRFSDLCNSLILGKGSGLLNCWWRDFFTSCCTWFLAFPWQISGLPAQFKFGDQPSKITNLHVLLEDWFYLQARPNNSHDQSAKYAGNINKPSFCGRLFFDMGYYWVLGSSSRGGFWPPFFYRRPWLTGSRRLLCCLRHGRFDGGGWTEAPLSRSAHRVPVLFFPCSTGSDGGISCDNSRINHRHAVLNNKYLTTLLEELTSWEVVSVSFSFLATCFRATLRGLLGSAGRQASKLVGGSSTRGIWVLTQNLHPAPSTQQTEQSWLNTRADSKACQSIFLKLTKDEKQLDTNLELAGW
jgi:hypothetical protein